MITCFIRYRIDRSKTKEFEAYAKMWLGLIKRFGGQHHGYFLPSEGRSDEALCLFSFPSLAVYEEYRTKAADDEEAKAAVRYAEERGLLLEWERSFFRPVLSE
jgi:hypothetical protein